MKQLLTKCWMVVLVAILAVPLKAQTISVQVDESGGLWDALEAQGVTDFSTVKSLTVTGTLGTPDFQLIKNLMTGLESVDLAGTDITEVPDRVFYERASLHTCRLPQGIVRIQNYVFERCYALSTLTFGNQEAAEGRIVFPASLRYIGGESFNECRLLTHLDFTACTALEGLAWNAFSSCYGLQQVLFPSQGSFGLGGSCFAFDTGTADEYGYGQSLQEVALTKAVTRLEGHCLPNRLKRLYVESVTPSECSDDAFDNIEKENLTIYVPKGCKRLYAVANGWTKVYTRMQELGFKVNVSGYGAVQKGNGTYTDGDVCFPNSNDATTLKAVPELGCELVSVKLDGNELSVAADGTFTIPAGTTVGTLDVVFTANPITIENPNGGELRSIIQNMGLNAKTIRALKVIGKMNSSDWTLVSSIMRDLEVIDLRETNVEEVPNDGFMDHTYLRICRLPENISYLRNNAFYNCKLLSIISFGDLGDNKFPPSLINIESSCFSGGCEKLESADLSACINLQSIDNFAFDNCTGLKTLILPKTGSYGIGWEAFKYVDLTTLTLTKAVNSIRCGALPNKLKVLYVESDTPLNTEGTCCFENLNLSTLKVYVPVGSRNSYTMHQHWSMLEDNIHETGFQISTNYHGAVIYGGQSYKDGNILFPVIGQSTTLKVVPDAGYEIGTVTLDGAAVALDADGTFTIPATTVSATIDVTFTNKQLEVAVTMEGNGSYTINGQTYTAATTLVANGGDVVALQLQPATGYFVKQVTINGENVTLKNGGLEVATKELDENTAIAITFSNDASSVATVTFQQDGFGAVNYGGETFEDGATLTVVKGKNLTLEIIPNGDSNLQSLTVNDVDVTADVADDNYVLNNVTANTTVKTSFFSPNMITVNNPNGGELKDLIVAMGSNSRTIRTLKVVGKLNNKDWAFVTSNLSRIEVFDISETNVKSVPESAFRDHQYLTTVHLPSTVVTINSWAFYNCQQLTTVNGCDNVEEIGERAFSDCSKLANFPFGSKLRSLSSAVFNNCTSLPKALVMPASLTSLGWDNVFNGSSVRTFDLSQCTLSCDLAYNTFGECTSLQLPERGDYRLGYSSMSNAKFKELRLPAALSYIYGEDVLPETLERLYVTRSKPIEVADNISFRKIDFDKCALYVPIGSMEAYSETPRWAEFSKVLEYGLKVTVGEQGKLRADGQTLMGTSTFFPMGAVTFTIIPNAGWHADAVTLNDVAIPFANNQFTLNADQLTGNLTVTFAINQFNLNLQIAGEGKVKLGSLVYTTDQVLPADSLSKLNFTLEPAEGLVVSGITFNGKESVVQNGGANYVTPAIVANSTLTIAFGASGALGDVVTYDVTTGENGTVEYLNTSLLPQTTIQVKKGVDAVFTIKPDDYYVIEKVTIDGNDVTGQVDADGLLTLTDVSGDATLEVTFVMNSHIVIALEKGVRLNNALTDAQKQVVTKLTVTGQLWEEDYYTMRDKMPLLAEVDLSKVDVSNMDYVPYKAFCVTEGWDSSVGKTSLESIRLPEGIRYISDWAFSGCGNLKEVNFAELNKLEGLGARAFGWTALNAVDLSQTKMTSLGSEFYKVKGLENVKLPKTISSLGDVFTESGLMEVDLSGCTELKTLDGTFRNSKKLEKVVLPEGLTAINGAFSECNALTTVNFPKSLQSIGSDAFNNTSLQAVDLSGCSQLVSIGWGAFRDSRGLGAVLLPASLQLLGENAFYNTVITTIDLSNTQVQDIKESTFNECRQLENIKLPANLKTIGNSAFANCEKVAGMIELPATIVSVGETAFWGTQVPVVKCHTATPPAITSNSFGDKWEAAFVPEGCAEAYKSAEIWEDKVILDHEVHAEVTVSFEGNLANDIVEQAQIAPAQVTHLKVHGPLGAKDFAIMRSNMTLLYDLDMEDAECSMIPENAFLDKKVLMNVKLPSELIAIQEGAFRGCSSLKGTLTLPVGLTTIGWAAFQGCSSLEKVELSPALEVIRGYAFEGCASLQQQITFPQNFTSLGEYAFANCRNLTGTVKFNTEFYMFMGNEGYWSSTGRAFENCSNIETVDMSDCEYLYQLPQGVFAGCTSLNTVMLPPYLERIEGYGFENDVNLLNITFPESLMYIDGGAFRNCSSLQRVDLSGCDNFGTIGDYAFADCASLEAVSLPASVNWIQGYAFSECRKLAEFNVEALEPADLGEYVFRHVHTERCVLSIPTGTYSDYLSAPQWGEFVSMRKAIDVALDEGASLTYSSGTGGVAGARGTHRAPSAEGQQGKVNVKDGSSLYVAENDNVTFYINPDENVSIKRVLFNGEDVTGQLQANAFVTPGLTENTTFEVQLNVDGPITVKELRITENEVGLKEAESIQLKATVYPTNATDKTIVWTSADESIARVSSEGVITGVAPGRTTITAKTNDGGLTKVIDIVIISNDYFITLAESYDTFVETGLQIPMLMHNADAAKGIQFDVYLPEGLDMENNGGSFNVSMTGRSNGHAVTTARRSDGSIRVMVFSQEGNSFFENDGELLSLPIITLEEAGEYEVQVKNIHISGPKSFDFTAPDYVCRVKVKDFPLGDSNGDGAVSISDVTNTVNQAMEQFQWVERFKMKPGDVNSDGIITVTDVSATAAILMGRDPFAASRAMAKTVCHDGLTLETVSVNADGRGVVELRLDNLSNYTGMQCDLFLPAGLKVACDDSGKPMVNLCEDQLGSHVLVANAVSNGAMRIMAVSMTDKPFAASEKGLVRIAVEADDMAIGGQYTVSVDNATIVNASTHIGYEIPAVTALVNFESGLTPVHFAAIDGMEVRAEGHQLIIWSPEAANISLVSVDGTSRILQLRAGENRVNVSNAGVYILNNRKVIIR